MFTLADLHVRQSEDICREAQKVAARIQPETPLVDPRIVMFAPEYEEKGLNVIYAVGPVWGMGSDKMALVPERTLKILKEMGIPYIGCD